MCGKRWGMFWKHDRESWKRLEYHIDLVLFHPHNRMNFRLPIHHHHLWGPPKPESYHKKKKRKELQKTLKKCPFSSSLQFCLVPNLSLTQSPRKFSFLDLPFWLPIKLLKIHMRVLMCRVKLLLGGGLGQEMKGSCLLHFGNVCLPPPINFYFL